MDACKAWSRGVHGCSSYRISVYAAIPVAGGTRPAGTGFDVGSDLHWYLLFPGFEPLNTLGPQPPAEGPATVLQSPCHATARRPRRGQVNLLPSNSRVLAFQHRGMQEQIGWAALSGGIATLSGRIVRAGGVHEAPG